MYARPGSCRGDAAFAPTEAKKVIQIPCLSRSFKPALRSLRSRLQVLCSTSLSRRAGGR